ncbi:LacI family DNA-binding transcriptional regulator [Spirilliplanes yamanashiensis]|uniref:LacI family transcriptional regulator n=1 Tax=Spirilliplanes yamanashiensis TaxID=42233 RepID=A0A8J3YCJ2_9ACTN|nr:LacI family DNA-binding transcriptional regulator [Spirilliplanes yamanashiensis]MDP9818922.1 DNA-binding LacI/PurR family transcriptional regulator [Spirilliplanes yamanashiensis]GIJ05377.1 LacI family transcriptional regulator [Spirilliplanes yamanashiensis]
MERLPTLEDVARVAGVSRATVSRVINNTRNVDPQLHEVVWNAVGATGYVPNRAARSLVTRRTGTVALVVSDAESHDDDPFMSRFFADPYFGRVVGGLMSVLRPAGQQLALQIVGTEDARARLVGDLRQGQSDGVVVLSLPPHDTLPRMLTDASLPAVMIGRPADPVPISYVDLANDTGAALAAEHLVARGCQRVGLISGPVDVPASQDRITGFRRAMARRGHAFVPSVAGNFTHDSGEAGAARLLADHPDLDGLFVANDLMAQGALLALRDAGRRVPDDVAVVGFDDSSAALAARPALTTVRHPLEDMAAESARLLLARIDDPSQRVTSVIYEPTLVVRGSA